ncbi:MAG: hypothetical protein KKD44_28415 [Proteobacteria bacterium]|nr:hypothetical protein [Pseudomonadota bacterium]
MDYFEQLAGLAFQDELSKLAQGIPKVPFASLGKDNTVLKQLFMPGHKFSRLAGGKLYTALHPERTGKDIHGTFISPAVKAVKGYKEKLKAVKS